VDDISIASKDVKQIEWFKSEFSKLHKTKDLGEIEKILGIEIKRNRKNRTIELSQGSYIRKMLRTFKIEQDKHRPSKTPMNGYGHIRPTDPNDERIDPEEYQRRIGSLMHLTTYTRPDIAFSLNKLSQFMKEPAKHHGNGLKSLMYYVRSTAHYALRYGPGGAVNLTGYSDADYAADVTDRKSTLGIIFMLGNGPVSWASQKQRSVATSTTEAEYMSVSKGAKQGMWMAQLLRDLGYVKYLGPNPFRVELKEDNKSTIHQVKNAHLNDRSKHIDIAYHHVRDLQRKGRINISYVPSEDMIADGLTKPLQTVLFERFIAQMRLNPGKVQSRCT